MQGKVRKMITEEKNKSWEKTCSTVESYLGGKRSTEAWRILKNLRKNENGGQCSNPIPTGKRETYFKGLLTENRECYFGQQETESEGMNEVGMDKINSDIEIVKMTVTSLKSNTSCGVGGMPAELLKSGTEKLYELLTPYSIVGHIWHNLIFFIFEGLLMLVTLLYILVKWFVF